MNVHIPASHGQLEGVLWTQDAPLAAAVVCHPHPLFGGTMQNPVAYRVADSLRRAGLTVLRFNFRGVGASTGRYDEGRGELDDARDALSYLADHAPGLPLWIAGYSFGAHTALELAAQDARITRGLAVGTPLSLFPFDFLSKLSARTAFLHPDQDEFASLPELRRALSTVPAEHQLFLVENADHYYAGRLKALEAALDSAVEWLAQPQR